MGQKFEIKLWPFSTQLRIKNRKAVTCHLTFNVNTVTICHRVTSPENQNFMTINYSSILSDKIANGTVISEIGL